LALSLTLHGKAGSPRDGFVIGDSDDVTEQAASKTSPTEKHGALFAVYKIKRRGGGQGRGSGSVV